MTVIGVGSNILVRDGGIPGVTVRLGRGLASIAIERAGGTRRRRSARPHRRIRRCRGGYRRPGVPVRNSRDDRRQFADECRCLWQRGKGRARFRPWRWINRGRSHTLDCDGLRLSYRDCGIDPGWIFVEARLRGNRGDRGRIAALLSRIREARAATQPVRARTGGSTFKNPPGESAWRLIDQAGCRGLVRGGAMVSLRTRKFSRSTPVARQRPTSKVSVRKSGDASTSCRGSHSSGRFAGSVSRFPGSSQLSERVGRDQDRRRPDGWVVAGARGLVIQRVRMRQGFEGSRLRGAGDRCRAKSAGSVARSRTLIPM